MVVVVWRRARVRDEGGGGSCPEGLCEGCGDGAVAGERVQLVTR